jgi:AmmeMemoRadiSam system protein B/AmmeMemoRadiSam system protein A
MIKIYCYQLYFIKLQKIRDKTIMEKTNIRTAAVAGMFYTEGKEQLSQGIEACLSKAKKEYDVIPKVLVVPHAGYLYSAEIAASAYVYLKEISQKIKRVLLFGPAHRVYFEGVSLSEKDVWETPLGNIEIDKESGDKIAKLDGTAFFDEAHEQEHSLEVQLPFLQKTLESFKLVPVCVGNASEKLISDIIDLFWEDEETLILISTDLSHFHNYYEAQKIDNYTANLIEMLDYEKLQGENACGFVGLRGMLEFCRNKNIQPIRLDIRNSGDTSGKKDKVVGYGSWIIDKNGKNQYILENYGKTLLNLAKESIKYGLEKGKPPEVDVLRSPTILQQFGASFVTLEINGNLRGCIGSIIANRSLMEDIIDNAYNSAFKDPRFMPVSQAEFDKLSIAISILSLPQPMKFTSEENLLNQLRQDIDGLIIEDMGRRAVYLPSVWEVLPDKQEFLDTLRQKAGLSAKHWSATFKAYRFITEYIK